MTNHQAFNRDYQLAPNISDDELERIREDNYKKVQQNKKVTDIIIAKYEERKDYLSFELIYLTME